MGTLFKTVHGADRIWQGNFEEQPVR